MFMCNAVLLCVLLYKTNNPNQTQNASNTGRVEDVKPKANPFTLGAQSPPTPGVQVNSLPHPFNLNGSMPYQVWVNGERLPLNSERAKEIVSLLDLEPFEQPKDTAEIHNGAGWLRPLQVQ